MRATVPKYQTIKAILQARFEREFEPGARLPTEVAFCKEFNVSRITIQKALALLEEERVIRREQGRGTFYLGAPVKRTETQLSELLESVIHYREGYERRVVSKSVARAPAGVAQQLRIEPNRPVVALDRVGFVDGEPLAFIRAWLSYEIGVKVLDSSVEDYLAHNTLAALLQERHGIVVDSVSQSIGAALADPAFAHYLGVEVGAPLLEGERSYFDAAGNPIFFTVTFYRADRHRFVVSLKNWRQPG